MKGHLLSINRYFQGQAVFNKELSLRCFYFSLKNLIKNRNENRDTIVLHAIRLKPMQELKKDDFLGVKLIHSSAMAPCHALL